jgi:hypothetical protein
LTLTLTPLPATRCAGNWPAGDWKGRTGEGFEEFEEFKGSKEFELLGIRKRKFFAGGAEID